MGYWWDQLTTEKYWVEITDRPDIGADLKCPQTKKGNQEYWSYSLIRAIWPGDIVFHYSTNERAFVGASVAGGPLEERAIVWVPHGTSGRASEEDPKPRPGWWLPLYGYSNASRRLTLMELQELDNQNWFLNWLEGMEQQRKKGEIIAAPFQPYPRKIRASQGYLTKMPAVFVERWSQLSDLVDSLDREEEELVRLARVAPPSGAQAISLQNGTFKPKSDEEYSAFIRGGFQRRSRKHESLVKNAADFLRDQGASISNPHPIDLLMTSPLKIIFEAKLIGNRSAGFGIREAIGQLYEYRHFIGPKDSTLCVLLDAEPPELFVTYVEEVIGFQIMWKGLSGFTGGPQTLSLLCQILDSKKS